MFAAEHGALAAGVDDRHLAIIAKPVFAQRLRQGLLRREPRLKPGKDLRSERGQRDVLAGHRANARQQPRAAGADGNAG